MKLAPVELKGAWDLVVDKRDFEKSPVKSVTPAELLALLPRKVCSLLGRLAPT